MWRGLPRRHSVAGSLSSHLPSLLVDLEEAGLSGVISNKMQVRRVLMLLLQAAMSSIHPSISHAIPPAGLTAADTVWAWQPPHSGQELSQPRSLEPVCAVTHTASFLQGYAISLFFFFLHSKVFFHILSVVLFPFSKSACLCHDFTQSVQEIK